MSTINIDIFKNGLIDIDIDIFKNGHIDIDIDIFKSVDILIIDMAYRTPLARSLTCLENLLLIFMKT